MTTIITIVSVIILIPIIFLTLIPVFPAIPLMALVTILYGLVTSFQTLQTTEIIILGSVLLLSVIVDYSSGLIGAKLGGAGRKTLFYGFLGVIIGTIIIPPFGGFVGLFLAVLFSELSNRKSMKGATTTATYSLLGSISGVLINFLLAIAFFVLFLVFVF